MPPSFVLLRQSSDHLAGADGQPDGDLGGPKGGERGDHGQAQLIGSSPTSAKRSPFHAGSRRKHLMSGHLSAQFAFDQS
jgi:hypothetical protein